MCSPLLQPPTEIILHIVSFVSEGYYRDYQSIFDTYHHISDIMLKATEIWWNVNV